MSDTPKLSVPTTIDIIRCPASQCVCDRRNTCRPGGALLLKFYRPTAQTGGTIEMACPRAKGSLVQVTIGEVPK